MLLRLKCLCGSNTLKFIGKQKTFHEIRFLSTTIASEEEASDNRYSALINSRLNLWNELKAEYDESLKLKTSKPIEIRVQYGRKQNGLSWQSTPHNIYREFNRKLASEAVVAKVNNVLWDLDRPLEDDCEVELLTFDEPLAKEVIWHSSSHLLGAALEQLYGSLLNTGPATENGFYYDVFNSDKNVSFKLKFLTHNLNFNLFRYFVNRLQKEIFQ